jgi:hypothetical protein
MGRSLRCLIASALLLLLVPSIASAAPTLPRLRLIDFPEMHLRIAIPATWHWRWYRQLREFRPHRGPYTLQGLFLTVTLSRTGNFQRDFAGFTLAFLQDPQQLSLLQYIKAYLGGPAQYHLGRTPIHFGNANEAYSAHADRQVGGQVFFIRFDGHFYWLAWNPAHTFGFWQITRYFRHWQFTR